MRAHKASGVQSAAALKQQLTSATVGLFGDRLHVVCTDPERTADEARAAMAQAGIEVGSIRVIEPSLEDVFISVLTENAK
jgi:ABC-2 type transport system ATP-binding protein